MNSSYLKYFYKTILLLSVFMSLNACAQNKEIQTQIIWESNQYAAFTSLIKYKGWYICAFREASAHTIKLNNPLTFGKIILIKSKDTKKWEKFYTIEQSDADLRDPKLSINPNGELQVLYGCRTIVEGKSKSLRTKTTFFKGKKLEFQRTEPIIIDNYDQAQWLWNLTWHNNKAYGFVYGANSFLVESTDGINYKILETVKPLGNTCTEGTIIFDDNKAIAVLRGPKNEAFYGISNNDYIKWDWHKLIIGIGGPALFKTSNNIILLGGRNYNDEIGKTTIYKIENNEAIKIMTLPSTIDSSYPSFIQVKKDIFVSYYSGNKENSKIYLIIIPLSEIIK